jgi:non-ribosomal peptide synthetase-like protein
MGIASMTPSRLHHFFESSRSATPSATALVCGGHSLTYRELDERASALADVLMSRGVGEGARVGILLHRSVETYVSLLGIPKAGAAFVPLDPGWPADRVDFVVRDADLTLVLSTSEVVPAANLAGCPVMHLDSDVPEGLIGRPASRRDPADPICYVIYTSGSTGRPKGVAIRQRSITNFVTVTRDLYGVVPADRVYQGMTIAFDFSIEEIWLTWAAGATLVAGPNDSNRMGAGLADFLEANDVTVLYCVPTVLATLDRDLPRLRMLIVGGEACPPELVTRWSRGRRRMLNTYGPTETTVTATMAELHPDKPVTIGRSLPTYQVRLLDENLRPVRDGDPGEICIGGIGVAAGYLNRPELTAERFVDDPWSTGNGRLYRSGDLGRMLPDGEIEYLGRIDSEIKLRGHRIDLREIEEVAIEDNDVLNAAATIVTLLSGDEIVLFLVRRSDTPDDDVLLQRVRDRLAERLPGYMVPAFLDLIDELPTLTSGKVDRSALPRPKARRFVKSAAGAVPSATPLEEEFRTIWAEILKLPRETVSVEADFFLDLGGHSLLAAAVISRLRENPDARDLSVADMYAHPTVRALAAHLQVRRGATDSSTSPGPPPRKHATGRLLRCGMAQLGVGYTLALIFGMPVSFVLASRHGRLSMTTLWLLLSTVPPTFVLARILLPIAAAQTLGRGLQPGRYPLWGLTYVRVWMLQGLLALSPASTLSGSPLLPVYLRLLGARVGSGCQIATAGVPLPRLARIGCGVSIGYGATLQSTTVAHGWLTIKPVVVADHCFVGAGAVLMPGSEVGTAATLAAQSLVAEDQRVPAGQHWAGSPSRNVARPDPLVESLTLREDPIAIWSPAQLAGFAAGWVAFELLPFLFAAPSVLIVWLVLVRLGVWEALLAAAVSAPLYVVTTCTTIWLGKHLVMHSSPTGVYPLRSWLGVRKWACDKLLAMSLTTTNTLYATLYTVPWLRSLGARIGPRCEVSTAAHLDPGLLTLTAESFVADMASVGSAIYCNGHLVLGHTQIGRRSFVGNAALLPCGARLRDSSLIGVHTVPPPGEVSAGTSWLGSPPIYLPRRQESQRFDEAVTYRPSRRRVIERLAIEFIRVTLPSGILATVAFSALVVAAAMAQRVAVPWLITALPLITIAGGLTVVFVVAGLKWAIVGRYRPRVEPLWSRFVRRTELVTGLYESAAVPALLGALTGTPMLGPLLRLFGTVVGKRCWIATTYLTEFDLVRLGDDVAIGTGTSLQTHLFEDRVMKMSKVVIEDGASVASRSVVLYDAVVGPHAFLDALSLAMKGEVLAERSRWRGIPCQPAGRSN